MHVQKENGKGKLVFSSYYALKGWVTQLSPERVTEVMETLYKMALEKDSKSMQTIIMLIENINQLKNLIHYLSTDLRTYLKVLILFLIV